MVEPIRILILEDVPADAALVERELRNAGLEFVASCVETEQEFIAALDEFKPHVILSDYTLPSFDGMAALRLARERVPAAPFIIVTGSINEETAAECIKAGAADYVLKDHLTRLPAALRGALERCRLDAEKRRAEEALRESEEKYRRILENMEESYFEVDLAGNLTFFNESLCRLLGYPRDELVGMNNRQFMDKENAKKLFRAFNKVYRTGQSNREFDGDVIRKDGTKRHVETSASLRRDSSGQPKGFAGLIRDVTERKRTEEDLRNSRQVIEGILNAIPVRVFWKDKNLVYLGCNAIFALDAGFADPKDLIGKDDYQMGWRDQAELYRGDDREVIESGCSKLLKEEPQTTPEGNTITLLTSKLPLRDSNGEIAGLLGTYMDITELKRAEKAWRESEERYRTLVAHSPDGIFLVDLKGNFLSANETICRELGFSEAEMLAMTLWDIVPEGQWETHKARLATILKGESLNDTVEYSVRNKAGQLVPVEVRSAPYRKGEEIVGFQGIARNITERKRADEALRESEEKYRRILENMEESYFEVDLAGNLTFFNESLCRLLGYPRDELVGMNNRQFTDKENTGKVFQAFNRIYTTGQSASEVNWEIVRKDGTKRHIETSASLRRDSSGQPIGFSGLFRDITERRRTQAALRESEERFRQLTETMPDAVMVGQDSRNVYANSAAARLLHAAGPEELVGRDVAAIVDPATHEWAWQKMQCALAGEIQPPSEDSLVRLDGSLVPVEIALSLLTWQGRPALQIVARDITERKRAEKALRESEERFRSLYENSTVGLYRTTPDGRILMANPTLVDMLGYASFDELASANLKDDSFQPSYPRAHFLEAMERDGEVRGMEAAWTRADESAVFISESVRAIRDSQGNTLYYDGSVENITERKKAEQEHNQLLLWQQGVNLLHQSLLAPAPLEDKLKIVTDCIVRLFDADFCRIWLIRPGDLCEGGCVHAEVREGPHVCRYRDRCLHLLASSGRYTHLDGQTHRRVPFGTYQIGRVASGEDHKFLTNDATSDPLVHNHGWARELGLVSFAGYQLRVPGGETLGVLALFAKHPILPAEDALLDGLSSALAQVIQRAQAEEALWASEERYRLIAENTADVIWTLDLATRRFTYVSPSIERLRGFTAEEALAQPFGASLTPDSLRRVDAHLAAAFAALAAGDESAKIGTMEADQPTKDGGTVRTEIVATALTDASGRVTGVLGVTRDVTQRKQAEEALRESEERFRSLYENSTIGLYRTTPDGRILMANPTLLDMLGYASFDELASRNLNDDGLWPSYSRARFLEAMERDGEVKGLEATWNQADGCVISIRESARAIRDAQGNTLYYDGSVENITERKQAEAEREELGDQLRQSQKMEAVGQLAGGVAHDFNNLLQAMLGLTHVLLTHCTDAERVTADAAELEQHVKHGAALTRQLLLFSRRETARPETLDLNEVIREAGKLLRRLVKGNVAVELRLTKRKLPVVADRGQLEQVLFNLTINAADAMPQGGRLVITTGSDASTVWLQVADTGVGIPAEIRQRIFEPFFTTKVEGKGTGLGLAVVHGIVAQHGGSITCESHEGQGTTFTITLPRGDSGEFAALKTTELAGEAPAGHGERVLIVEDEAAARDSLAEILTVLGYEVVALESGEEAGLLPPEPAFEVLLTDIMLPGIAGADLARGLLERWPELKVILMSGYTEDEAIRKGISASPVRFLQKPFGMSALARELRSALDDAPAAGAGSVEP